MYAEKIDSTSYRGVTLKICHAEKGPVYGNGFTTKILD